MKFTWLLSVFQPYKFRKNISYNNQTFQLQPNKVIEELQVADPLEEFDLHIGAQLVSKITTVLKIPGILPPPKLPEKKKQTNKEQQKTTHKPQT